jgi:hypothetical protein
MIEYVIEYRAMIEYIVYFISLAAIVLLYLIERNKKRKLLVKNVQLTLDKTILTNKMSELLDAKNNVSLEQTEGFIKFISQSRDLAFNYIEDVQKALTEFDIRVRPLLLYMSASNNLDSEMNKNIKNILIAYDELKKMLPSDDPL